MTCQAGRPADACVPIARLNFAVLNGVRPGLATRNAMCECAVLMCGLSCKHNEHKSGHGDAMLSSCKYNLSADLIADR